MNRHFVKIGIYLLAGFWASTPMPAGTEEEAMAVFTMSEQHETCIQVQAGQKFSLKFVTSPGTGYEWELAAPIDERLLAILEIKSETPETWLLGASEYAIWVCRALSAGCGLIALKYARPWEKNADPAKTHVFKVHIQ